MFDIKDILEPNTLKEALRVKAFQEEFFQLFGFEVPGVDYEKDSEPSVQLNPLPL